MPDPAAISTWCAAVSRSGVKFPVGDCTSITSPARTSCTSQLENKPPGISRTPTRGRAPAGAQIEYERRSSRPSIVRLSVKECPGRKGNSSASSRGTSKVTATASSHRDSTSATVKGWKPARRRTVVGALTLDLLDMFERFETGAAAAQRLAGGGTEPRNLFSVGAIASRATNLPHRGAERERNRTGHLLGRRTRRRDS